MESSRSPRKVMNVAWQVGSDCLPAYSSKFSRHDFTLPQLFACLVVRQFYNLSYRRAAALLADGFEWCRDIGMSRVPDHRTLCDAFKKLATDENFSKMLDHLVRHFEEQGLLGLEEKPAAIDATCFESRHVSRHFERRQREGRSKSSEKTDRSKTVRSIPKMGIAVAAACHVILAAQVMTGMGADDPHFEPVLFEAWRRADVKRMVADAGYDSESAHCLSRDDMGIESIIPPWRGRPSSRPPPTHYRRLMYELFESGAVKEAYGQRWQAETVNSMMKRNYGSALRARTAAAREREMMLKVVTHNVAL